MNQAEDVEIVLSPEHRYKFHASTLARYSAFFADAVTERKAARLSKQAKLAGATVRWMFELTLAPCEDYPAGVLSGVPLDRNGKPEAGGNGLILNENGVVPTRVFEHYESIFYAFYGKDIKFTDTDMGAAVEHVSEIICIAQYLRCELLISKPVDVALVKHGQALYRSIQAKPWLWVDIACRIRSEIIFKEAVIHLAGNWRRIKEDENIVGYILPEYPKVFDLCESLHRQLIKQAKELEFAISSLYPGRMCEPVKVKPIKREEYSKDILVWMALSFFRHWLVTQFLNDQGVNGPDCGFSLYYKLGQAGDAYMGKGIINQFHNKFPITKKAMNVLENHLLEIKECVKGCVDQKGVLKSTCQYDTTRWPVDYMTCAELKGREYPWVEENDHHVHFPSTKKGMRPGGNEVVKRNLAAAQKLAAASESNCEAEDMDTVTYPRKRARVE